jgi:hypothetical protein
MGTRRTALNWADGLSVRLKRSIQFHFRICAALFGRLFIFKKEFRWLHF